MGASSFGATDADDVPCSRTAPPPPPTPTAGSPVVDAGDVKSGASSPRLPPPRPKRDKKRRPQPPPPPPPPSQSQIDAVGASAGVSVVVSCATPAVVGDGDGDAGSRRPVFPTTTAATGGDGEEEERNATPTPGDGRQEPESFLSFGDALRSWEGRRSASPGNRSPAGRLLMRQHLSRSQESIMHASESNLSDGGRSSRASAISVISSASSVIAVGGGGGGGGAATSSSSAVVVRPGSAASCVTLTDEHQPSSYSSDAAARRLPAVGDGVGDGDGDDVCEQTSSSSSVASATCRQHHVVQTLPLPATSNNRQRRKSVQPVRSSSSAVASGLSGSHSIVSIDPRRHSCCHAPSPTSVAASVHRLTSSSSSSSSCCSSATCQNHHHHHGNNGRRPFFHINGSVGDLGAGVGVGVGGRHSTSGSLLSVNLHGGQPASHGHNFQLHMPLSSNLKKILVSNEVLDEVESSLVNFNGHTIARKRREQQQHHHHHHQQQQQQHNDDENQHLARQSTVSSSVSSAVDEADRARDDALGCWGAAGDGGDAATVVTKEPAAKAAAAGTKTSAAISRDAAEDKRFEVKFSVADDAARITKTPSPPSAGNDGGATSPPSSAFSSAARFVSPTKMAAVLTSIGRRVASSAATIYWTSLDLIDSCSPPTLKRRPTTPGGSRSPRHLRRRPDHGQRPEPSADGGGRLRAAASLHNFHHPHSHDSRIEIIHMGRPDSANSSSDDHVSSLGSVSIPGGAASVADSGGTSGTPSPTPSLSISIGDGHGHGHGRPRPGAGSDHDAAMVHQNNRHHGKRTIDVHSSFNKVGKVGGNFEVDVIEKSSKDGRRPKRVGGEDDDDDDGSSSDSGAPSGGSSSPRSDSNCSRIVVAASSIRKSGSRRSDLDTADGDGDGVEDCGSVVSTSSSSAERLHVRQYRNDDEGFHHDHGRHRRRHPAALSADLVLDQLEVADI